MKQELINRISSCCLLPFSLMMTWIDSLIFPNDADGSFKAYLKTQIMTNGELRNEAWILLLQNAEFEENSPITSAVAVGWLEERTCPTCNQLEVIINALKISPNFPLFVESNVLDLIELDFNLYNITDLDKNSAFMKDGKEYFVHVPEFKIKNFDLIKDANPYLIVERLKPSKRVSIGLIKKNGWKRDRTLMVLGGEFWKSWEGAFFQEVTEEYYRPNEIPLTNAKQSIDLMLHNYFGVRNLNGYRTITKKGFGGKSVSHDRIQPKILNPITQEDGYIRPFRKQKINLRLRIGFKIGNNEKVSKPLKYFSIFATTKMVELGGNIEQHVFVSIGK